ncbi:DUF1428 domain-containing protein [Pleionea sp. CnH1-48]|uniref:DUF1428 domain-containing protein n=1 Tax=Pleionea sp. CnH1-48 TaxID=2954494 RepID=UPI0020985E48|nr:DUF1428 domain-containing protein [Pleionea sp. CnH1-48]MCO7225788.1 DUF1428 family protein [Pleionea sp. CnH1-48]
MSNYIDGFVLPIPRDKLSKYREVVEKVAAIWKEHGALDYREYVGDDFSLAGTGSFIDGTKAKDDEVIIFGWATFESREVRDLINEKVASDPRMTSLVNPITESSEPIFDAKRMMFGGFKPLL